MPGVSPLYGGNIRRVQNGVDTLIYTLIDGAWKAEILPRPPDTEDTWPGSVACPATCSCIIAGARRKASDGIQTATAATTDAAGWHVDDLPGYTGASAGCSAERCVIAGLISGGVTISDRPSGNTWRTRMVYAPRDSSALGDLDMPMVSCSIAECRVATIQRPPSFSAWR